MTFKNVNFFVSNRNKNTQRIQTLTKNILLFLLSILLFSNISQSSHIVSADITYECLGNNSYKINLKLYRNCSGIPMGLFQIVNYNSVSCGGGGNLLMIPDTSYEVSQVCDSLLSQTTCNGGTLPGIEVYIFSATVTLPNYCTDWIFKFDECCRSTNINNLSPGFRFYTHTTLNNSDSVCNSSPEFKSIPILYNCVNEPVNFNNIASDPEGDSLSFRLIQTHWSATGSIPYSPVIQTPQSPFPTVSGVIFDSISGQMSFTSNAFQQVIATMLILEYDSLGNVKGTHIRDIEFIIVSCAPPPFVPKVSGYFSTQLIINASNGCSDTTFMNSVVYVHTNPIAGFDVDLELDNYMALKVDIADNSVYGTSIVYTMGDGSVYTIPNFSHIYKTTGSQDIWQIVTNDFGCIDSALRTIYTEILGAYVPNSFTPNSDGLNDEFTPIVTGDEPAFYKFMVYNRWGEIVFESETVGDGWDGTFKGEKAQSDTYVWTLRTGMAGVPDPLDKKGHVTLIR